MYRVVRGVSRVVGQQARGLGSLLPDGPDPHGLREFSVVYTDRAVNHMSKSFQHTMQYISSSLNKVYNSHSNCVIPGSGTYGMEAVARQFVGKGDKAVIIRNGWFSYRWTQIFEATGQADHHVPLKARFDEDGHLAPIPIDQAVAAIKAERPKVVCAPHVETSAGVLLPDDYIKQLSDAVHEVGGIMVLDGIASGCLWVDMKALGVDVYITAPQKGWSGPACVALVMFSEKADALLAQTSSSSFTIDLAKWRTVMKTYEDGAHMYHATMPTDALISFASIIAETEQHGYDKIQQAQLDLGRKAVDVLEKHGVQVLAKPGFRAPGVVVSYTKDDAIKSGARFLANGVQIAGGVPLQCDEPADFKTFRLGLFGLDKLLNVDKTVEDLDQALHTALYPEQVACAGVSATRAASL
eukprot:TRINITY_DN19491_c0_g1_i1.p1 TRINITY_DN19491_c0_g1~~TRINITY_DN19491_c0_g1_i1.p1  ORF type:complete len:411 (+),score=153.30 TRINITY_DN19491_c0_g1_i1:58-1290(+)